MRRSTPDDRPSLAAAVASREDTPTKRPTTTMLSRRLRLGTGFAGSEREEVLERLNSLGSRLRSFPEDTVELQLSVKDRSGADQRLTLECWIAGRSRLVSRSMARYLPVALAEVRDDMVDRPGDLGGRDPWEDLGSWHLGRLTPRSCGNVR
jgi:hypothetical protein